MQVVCLSGYGKLRRLRGIGDDRAFIGNTRINKFGH